MFLGEKEVGEIGTLIQLSQMKSPGSGPLAGTVGLREGKKGKEGAEELTVLSK